MSANALYGVDERGNLVCSDEERMPAKHGVSVTRKAAAGNHGLPYTLYEIVLAPHHRAPLPLTPEGTMTTIYITEGTLAVRLNEQTITVNAGSLVHAPEQTTCIAWNPTSNRVRCLAIVDDKAAHNRHGSLLHIA